MNSLIGAVASFIDAFKAWSNNEPGSGDALATSQNSSPYPWETLTNNPALESTLGELGVPTALFSLANDISAYNAQNVTDEQKLLLYWVSQAQVSRFLLPSMTQYRALAPTYTSIDWLIEASNEYGVTLSNKELSRFSSFVYKEAVEKPLNFDETKYLAFTAVKILKMGRVHSIITV